MPKGTIKGLNKTLKQLKQFGKEVEEEVEEVLEANAKEIVFDARQRAPKNIGRLSGGIDNEKDGALKQVIFSDQLYAGYVEFGTGAKVDVPSEMNDVANAIKNNPSGSFEQGLEQIKQWCKDIGIEEEAAYPIFVSILNNGIDAQPFMYPAFVKGREQFLKDLKKMLKRLTNKV